MHITGTTRIGTDPVMTSVADPSSKVHGLTNFWVSVVTDVSWDSTACNPTLVPNQCKCPD
ncbi:hypothetical protein IW261DRAFT_1573663 [Armillaria novae-zelandiae]|uniref:Uncharacterized protein n=1 Tax=Armillaria novae-zelandiae TaxID=153914 RepID=A0AA39U7E2_9AGAR|nr:hypothetical protein IW261DRAFT_1573663 [Armillaria novae-zelandiae]